MKYFNFSIDYIEMNLNERFYTSAILCTTVGFLFADQNLLAPNLSLIAKEFHFSDSQRDNLLGGQIALGFFVIGGIASIIIGCFADRMSRSLLFGIIVCLGEGACLGTYWTKTYIQLYICRILTGISIGGATPIMYSLMADLYPGSTRVAASTLVGVSMSLGISLGQLLAGIVGPEYGWRVPFLIVAAPALFCSFLILTVIKEPERGNQEEQVIIMRESINDYQMEQTCDISISTKIVYTEKINFSKIISLFQTRTILLIFLQGIPGCLPWGMVYTFLNDYFSNDRGLSIFESTLALTVFGIGGIIGQLLGGMWGQHLYNKDRKSQCFLMGFSTILGVCPMLYIINGPTPGSWFFYCMCAAAGVLANATGPNVRCTLQNVSAPETRGTAFALFNLTDDLGKGVGPAVVVALMTAAKLSRQHTFSIVCAGWLLCGAAQLAMVATVQGDEADVQRRVASNIQQCVSTTKVTSALHCEDKQRVEAGRSEQMTTRVF